MIATLARQDYEAMLADGLPATLEDFDRLNSLALRIERGAETTAANFPRIGWAGDTPFHQPTCAAIAWYWTRVERTAFSVELKNSCWFFALNRGRTAGAFDGLDSPEAIADAVNAWLATVHATQGEMSRACAYAVNGYDDAEAERTDAQKAEDEAKTDEERRDGTLDAVSSVVTRAAALTGVSPADAMLETPSRLAAMVCEVERLHDDEGAPTARNRSAADEYERTHRAIRMRLAAEKASKAAKEV